MQACLGSTLLLIVISTGPFVVPCPFPRSSAVEVIVLPNKVLCHTAGQQKSGRAAATAHNDAVLAAAGAASSAETEDEQPTQRSVGLLHVLLGHHCPVCALQSNEIQMPQVQRFVVVSLSLTLGLTGWHRWR